jgi:hypothetical protein
MSAGSDEHAVNFNAFNGSDALQARHCEINAYLIPGPYDQTVLCLRVCRDREDREEEKNSGASKQGNLQLMST